MSTNKTTIKERLVEFAKFKNIALTKLASMLGVSNGYFTYKKGEISASVLQNIYDKFPDINKEWLLTGEGDKIILESEIKNQKLHISTMSDKVPVIPTSIIRETDIDTMEYIRENPTRVQFTHSVKQFASFNCFVPITNESMEPEYMRGDQIALKEMPLTAPIINGATYGIDTNSIGMLVRKITDIGDKILCKANNKDFQDFYIDKSDIIHLFRVVGLLRVNA